MVNYDILFAIVFYAVLLIYYFTHKEKFEVQGKIFVMYKTQLGIKLMDKIAGFSPRLLNFLGGLGILVGFVVWIVQSGKSGTSKKKKRDDPE